MMSGASIARRIVQATLPGSRPMARASSVPFLNFPSSMCRCHRRPRAIVSISVSAVAIGTSSPSPVTILRLLTRLRKQNATVTRRLPFPTRLGNIAFL